MRAPEAKIKTSNRAQLSTKDATEVVATFVLPLAIAALALSHTS